MYIVSLVVCAGASEYSQTVFTCNLWLNLETALQSILTDTSYALPLYILLYVMQIKYSLYRALTISTSMWREHQAHTKDEPPKRKAKKKLKHYDLFLII